MNNFQCLSFSSVLLSPKRDQTYKICHDDDGDCNEHDDDGDDDDDDRSNDDDYDNEEDKDDDDV